MVQISSKTTHNERCAISPQVIGEDVQAAPENHILQDQETTPAAANYENSSLTSSQGMPTNIQSGHGNDVNSQGPHMNIQPGPDVNTRMNLIPTGNGNDVSNMASMFAAALVSTFPQCFSGMQQSVNTSISDKIHKGNSDFDLAQWYSHRNVNDVRALTITSVPVLHIHHQKRIFSRFLLLHHSLIKQSPTFKIHLLERGRIHLQTWILSRPTSSETLSRVRTLI